MFDGMHAKKILWIGVCLLTLGAAAQAATLTVNKAGTGGAYTDFSQALAAAGSGDTIQFTDTAAVVYDESAATVAWPSADGNAKDNLTVTATTPGVVTLRGRQDVTGHTHYTVRNITLEGGPALADAVFYQADSFGTFENCTFKIAAGATGNAHLLYVLNGSVTATGCTFQDTPGEQCSAFYGDYTATLNATDCHFKNLAGYGFRSGGEGFNVNLTRCDSTGISTRVMFLVYAGNVTITQSNLSVKNKLLEAQPFDKACDVTVNVSRSKIDGTEIMINGSSTATLKAAFDNCIFSGFWVPLYAYSATADSTLSAYHCLFLATNAGAVTFGDGYDTITVKNSIITEESRGFNTGGNFMTLVEDYNVINMPGGYMAGAHDLDGRETKIDPLFVNAAAGDYHIQPGSPCAGKGAVLAEVTTDWDGDPRPQPASAAATDIGIDEINDAPNAARPSWTIY